MLPQNKISGTKIAFGHGAFLYDEKEKGFFNFVKESDFGWLLPISTLQKENVTEQDLLDCVEQVEASLGDPEELRAVLPFGSGLKNVGTVFRSKSNPRVICVFTPTSQLVQDVVPLGLPEEIRPDGYFEWYLSDEDSITVDDIGSGGNNVGAMGKWLGEFDRMAGTRNTNVADAPVFTVPTYTEAVQHTSGVMGAVQREVFLEDVHAYHRKQMPWFKKEQLKKQILGTWESVQRVRSSLTEEDGTYKSNVPLYLETVTGVEPVKFVFHGFIAESRVSLGEQEGLGNLKKFCESQDNLSRLRLMTDCGLRKARALTESNGNLVLEFEGEEQVLPQDEDLFKALKNKQPAKPTPKGTLIQGLNGRMDLSNETFRPYNKGLIVFLRDGSFPDVKRIFDGKSEVLLWIDAQIYLARLNEEFKALQTGRALPNQSTALSVMGDLLNNPQKGQERFAKLFVKEPKPVGESALGEADDGMDKEFNDDSGVVHYAIKKPFSGYASLCGNNGMNITVNGAIRRVYGGAKRTTDPKKVNCKDCLDLMKKKVEPEKVTEADVGDKFFIVYKGRDNVFAKGMDKEFVLDGFKTEQEAKQNLAKWKKDYEAYIVDYDPAKKVTESDDCGLGV